MYTLALYSWELAVLVTISKTMRRILDTGSAEDKDTRHHLQRFNYFRMVIDNQ